MGAGAEVTVEDPVLQRALEGSDGGDGVDGGCHGVGYHFV